MADSGGRPTNDVERPGLAALIGYGGPALPLAVLGLPVYIFLPTFYAKELGLGMAWVGGALLAARIWDVISDPLVGILSDRTRTRFGRRRPWVVAGTLPVMLATWFLFVPPTGAGGWHLLLWSLVLYTGWTMMTLPHSAWGAELTDDYHGRSRVVTFREGFLLAGTVLALTLPAATGLGDADRPGAALSLLALLVVIALPLAVIGLLALTPEPLPRLRRTLRAAEGIRLIAGNRAFRRLILAYLLNGIANGLPATLFLLFVSHVLVRPDQAGMLLLLYFVAGILAVPLWLRLSYRFGKHRVWSGAMIWACAVFLTVPFLGSGDTFWFALICIGTGISLGADLVLPASMQADVVDLDTVESGTQRAGVFFALWGMATKLALALAVGIAFPLLDLVGFGEASADGAPLWGLVALYSLVPILFKVAAIVLIWRHPVTEGHLTEVRRRIEDRAAPRTGDNKGSLHDAAHPASASVGVARPVGL